MLPIKIQKVVLSNHPDPNRKPFTFYIRNMSDAAAIMPFKHGYRDTEVVSISSNDVDFSTVTGERLSFLMMAAQEHQYKEVPNGFREDLTLAEQFLYYIFS